LGLENRIWSFGQLDVAVIQGMFGGSLDLDGSSDLDYPRLIFVGSSGLGWFSLDLVGFFRGYGCFSGVRSFNAYIY